MVQEAGEGVFSRFLFLYPPPDSIAGGKERFFFRKGRLGQIFFEEGAYRVAKVFSLDCDGALAVGRGNRDRPDGA